MILTKDRRPPLLCRHCTVSLFLGLTNTCCNRNGLHMYPNIKPIGIRDQNYAWVQVVTVKKDKIELNLASQQVTTFPVELALHSE